MYALHFLFTYSRSFLPLHIHMSRTPGVLDAALTPSSSDSAIPKEASAQASSPTWMDSLTGNPLFTAGFGLLGATVGLSLARRVVIQGSTLLQRRLLVSLEIPSNDRSYPWFLHWLSAQQTASGARAGGGGRSSHQLAVETNLVRQASGAIRAQFSLVPGQGKHYFRYQGAWVRVNRERDKRFKNSTTGTPWETISLKTLMRDRWVFERMLREAEEAALARQEGRTTIFTSYGPNWQAFGAPRRRRRLDSVILADGVAEGILSDIRDFTSSGEWYTQRGIPYRRGYLLHGPPGTGKSSFIQALAGELEWNICLLNLAERGLTDDRLNHLLINAPDRAIILLEDVDAAFTKRDPNAREG